MLWQQVCGSSKSAATVAQLVIGPFPSSSLGLSVPAHMPPAKLARLPTRLKTTPSLAATVRHLQLMHSWCYGTICACTPPGRGGSRMM